MFLWLGETPFFWLEIRLCAHARCALKTSLVIILTSTKLRPHDPRIGATTHRHVAATSCRRRRSSSCTSGTDVRASFGSRPRVVTRTRSLHRRTGDHISTLVAVWSAAWLCWRTTRRRRSWALRVCVMRHRDRVLVQNLVGHTLWVGSWNLARGLCVHRRSSAVSARHAWAKPCSPTYRVPARWSM